MQIKNQCQKRFLLIGIIFFLLVPEIESSSSRDGQNSGLERQQKLRLSPSDVRCKRLDPPPEQQQQQQQQHEQE